MASVSTSAGLESIPVRTGDIIAKKYRVDAVLGAGGMGVVVAVTHTQLNQKFAIKFLLPKAHSSPKTVERFMREAQAAVQIRSEHVARVFDIGALDTGAPYIVMEFLQGNDLAQELQRRGVLPLREAVDYILQACEALSEAHSLGIVHRDLKPSNLFLVQRADGSRQVKVLDFGISKLTASSAEEALTTTAAIIGSPRYMSPEQIRHAKQVDHRTDVWALGVTLYELVGGKLPFVAEDMGGLLASIIADQHKGIRELNPDVPATVEQLLNKCLAKNRDQRVANVAELALGLRPYASEAGKLAADRAGRMSGPVVASALLGSTAEASATLPDPDSNEELGQFLPQLQTRFDGAVTQAPKPKRAASVVAGVAVAAVATAAFFYIRSSTTSTEQALLVGSSSVVAPSLSAENPVQQMAEREASFAVVPSDASVTVNLVQVVVAGGRVPVRGQPGDKFEVAVRKDQRSQKATLTMNADGSLVPNEVRLSEPLPEVKAAPVRLGDKNRVSKESAKVGDTAADHHSTHAPAATAPIEATPPKTSGVGPVDNW